MPFTVKVSNVPGFTFEVEDGETILEAAERQGVYIPVGCENGLCGTCRGHLDEGEIDYGGKEIFGLMPEEMEAGDILFCSAMPKSDVSVTHDEIQVPDQQYHQDLKIVNREALSSTVWAICLKTDSPWLFKPGQYVNVHFKGEIFPLSLSNAPGTEYLELQVQIYPETPNHALLTEMVNAKTLNIEGPFGEAYLRPGSRPLMLIAGGSGFAPLKSIIENLVKTGSKRQIHLYWGARKPDYLYANEMVSKWARILPNFHYTPVISEDTSNWDGKTGLVHQAVLNDFDNLMSFEFYMAGPFAMVYAARDDLIKKGVSPRVMHADALEFKKS